MGVLALKVGMGVAWAGAWGQGLEGGHQGAGGGVSLGQGVAVSATGQWAAGSSANMSAQCKASPGRCPCGYPSRWPRSCQLVVVQHSQLHLHLLGWAGRKRRQKVG